MVCRVPHHECLCRKIHFDVPPAELLTVVEGTITDAAPPYTVKVSKGFSLGSDSATRLPLQGLRIKLFDDAGNAEDLTETRPGVYVTGGVIQGQVGHSYHIRLETPDGKLFESDEDKINPVGEIENIRYEYEARTLQSSYGTLPADVFKIYLDAQTVAGDENYVRWRFKGTYKVITHPELHETEVIPYTPYKTPRQCSGYVVFPALGGGVLVKESECTCCTCWISQYETAPQLSDAQLVTDNGFRNVKIGEAPINTETFFEKYLIEVDQMSLTRKAFEFFSLVRAQKQGASSLFQPPSGEIRGNIRSLNSTDQIVGLFWATSIRSKSKFILRSEVPYNLTPITFVTEACDVQYRNASTSKPANWE